MKHSIRISILMVIAIISNSSLFATIRTWNGSTSTAWATTSNWSGNTLPTTSDTVIIPNNLSRYPVISSNNTNVRRIVINGSLASITNNNGRSLSVTSMEINGGTYTCTNSFTATNVTLNGGTITSGASCTFTISGVLIINSGTVDLRSANQTTIASSDINGGSLTIDGNDEQNLFTGEVNLDGGSFIVENSSSTIQTSSSGIFNFISGTINTNDQLLDIRGKFNYTGGNFQTGSNVYLATLNFNKSSNLTLNFNLKIRDSLNFINGSIVSSATYPVIFRYTGVASGANSSKHINGIVKKEVSQSNTTPDFTFPIGNGTYYAPITISNFGNRSSNDTFVAQYFNSVNSNANSTLGSGLSLVSKQEYWILDRTSSGTAQTTATVTLSYNTSRSGSITNAALLKVARWDGTQWVDHGRATGSSTSNTSGTLTSSANVSSFSPFTLGSSSNVNPLPVKLLNFSAEAIASNVNVKWTTTSEINNDFFNVEKSLDGKNWSVIGTVKGAGNTEALTNYNFVDANPVIGMQYYRLQQNDINGEFTYSAIAPVNFTNAATSQISIFPMPANNFINVELPGVSEMSVAIYNSNGQKVFEATSGNLQTIDIQDFNAGYYIIEVKADNNVISSKFLKN